MSNYKKSNVFDKIRLNNEEYDWFEIWDALYYNFINNHTTYLKKIYATANSVSQFNKKSETDKKNLLKIAKEYMDKY